mgnify:CR=1 FL=1|jgi:hypothetical protein
MSLKIKLDDSQMWTPDDSPFCYGSMTVSSGIVYDADHTFKIKFHPHWMELMNDLCVGDIVTDSKGRVGLLLKEVETTIGMKQFVTSFSGEEEILYSFLLRKVEE